MAAERRSVVSMNFEAMGQVDAKPLYITCQVVRVTRLLPSCLLSWATCDNALVAFLVDHHGTDLALVALFVHNTPDEVLAM